MKSLKSLQSLVGANALWVRVKEPLAARSQSGVTQGTFSLFPSWCDSCTGVNLDRCFGLLYIVNAVCIYFLPVLVSAPQGWSVYISTTGWKWVSACLIKSIMLLQTLYLLKQLREAWNPSGKSKLCPSGSGWSCLQFQAWCCICLCWHDAGDDVTLNCSGVRCMVWDRAPRSWCEVPWCCCARGGVKPQPLHEHQVVVLRWCCQRSLHCFQSENCVFILICCPRSNFTFRREPRPCDILFPAFYVYSFLPAKITNPFFYSILCFSNADEQFSG